MTHHVPAHALLALSTALAAEAERAGVPELPAGAACTWADVDGDGRLELLVVGEGRELRLLGFADGVGFADATERAGLAGVRGVRALELADYDGDGRVDLFVAADGGASRLLRNEGGGAFRDRTAASGLAVDGDVLAARWLDHDGDGRPDLHVVARGASRVFRGIGGGRFEELALPPVDLAGGARPHAARIQVAPDVVGHCADALHDVAHPGACLEASSLPQLGKLFPINKRLYVDTLGRVGFGTTTPLSKMHVVTNAPQHCIVYLESFGPTWGESGIRFRTGRTTLSGWDVYMDDSTLDELGDADRLGFYNAAAGVVMALDVVGGSGRVGINKRDPSVALDVLGDVCVGGGGMYLTCSDARLKTDVTELDDALARALRLRGVRFLWTGGRTGGHEGRYPDGPQLGFLAQEVAEVLPEVVAVADDGSLSVDYGRLTPLLVEALREQQTRIDELAAEARRTRARLEERMERLEATVAELAARAAPGD